VDSSRSRTIVLGLLLPAALALYVWNNDFPLGFHYDEPKKVGFILDGDQDFHHPLLMLHVARAANAVMRCDQPQDVVVLGRTTTAFAGVLLVLFAYWLSRQLVSGVVGLLIAAGVALSPMTAMHAHYLKEDVLFAAWAVASLASYVRLLREPTLGKAVLLGVATGLAGASQYKAGLLVPLYVLFPLCVPCTDRKRLYSLGGLAAFIAVDVFVLVNLPMVADFQGFLQGIEHDRRQLADPALPIGAMDQWCTFYWRHGLAPGMTLPLAATGLTGLCRAIARWTSTPWEWKLLACYALLFYFAQELSSSKPPPNHERYMAPVAPVLICFAAYAAALVKDRCHRHAVLRAMPAVLVACMIAYAGIVSVRLCKELSNDTRQRAVRWVSERGGPAAWERFAGREWTLQTAAGADVAELRAEGVRYVVTSSFGYGICIELAESRGQPGLADEMANGYRKLFASPYVEIRPEFRSFGFSNPVVRIVEISTPVSGDR
jgi:hypothetical protein